MPSLPETPMPDAVTELLRQPNPAVMATVAADGRPLTAATWYVLEDDGTLLLGLDASRKRLDHLRRDGRVSLTALKEGDWYTTASVQGRVVDVTDDEGLAGIDRISRHYTGSAYPVRDRARVLVRVEVDRWQEWGVTSSH